MCGWLKDPFGVSWQIIPANLGALIMNPVNGQKAMQALMKMKKLVIDELVNA
jgi:predicted 3-demethylubiquinone-9 3-methyltransferase (glyoxalase superfamily)